MLQKYSLKTCRQSRSLKTCRNIFIKTCFSHAFLKFSNLAWYRGTKRGKHFEKSWVSYLEMKTHLIYLKLADGDGPNLCREKKVDVLHFIHED